jgi:hypothetical protein
MTACTERHTPHQANSRTGEGQKDIAKEAQR